MFKRVGDNLQRATIAIFVFLILVSLGASLGTMFTLGHFLTGFIVLIIGVIVSCIITILLMGFAVLLSSIDNCKQYMAELTLQNATFLDPTPIRRHSSGGKRGSWTCIVCHEINSNSSNNCIRCGSPQNNWRCEKCGEINSSGMISCTRCGTHK